VTDPRRPADAARAAATPVPDPDAPHGEFDDEHDEDDEHPNAPWHFKLLLLGTVGYLIYRFIWFIAWCTGHAWHG
jgi:hypothetical protein